MDPSNSPRAALDKGLRELGYVEGKTLAWERRFANGRFERLPALAAELVRLNVDILLVGGGAAVLAAKNATSTIPIVMVVAADPVAMGLVRSLAHPSGNVTGVTTSNAEIQFKRLDLLLELAPKSRRVGVLWNPANPAADVRVWEATEDTVRRERHVEIVRFEARSPSEIETAFQRMKRDHIDSLRLGTDYLLIKQEKQIADLAIASRLPSMSGWRSYATNGGLAAYDTDFTQAYFRAASYIDKIAKGAKPGELPVARADIFELWVNQRTAGLIGCIIPEAVLLRASKVIQ